MKRLNNKPRLIAPTLFVSFVFLLTGYLVIAERSCPNIDMIGLAETPVSEYMDYVWPQPETSISLYCYYRKATSNYSTGRGVGAGLSTVAIDRMIWETPVTAIPPVYTRTILFVDGKMAPLESFNTLGSGLLLVKKADDGKFISSGRDAGYDVSWVPLLLPGKHIALIEITRDTGEKLTFTWVFTITLF